MDTKASNFTPPKRDKHRPLESGEDKAFYEAAKQIPDVTTELCARVLLDYGLRNDELVHTRSNWVDKEPDAGNGFTWYIKIPRMAYCTGGSGPIGRGNPNGANLHQKGKPCATCRQRTHKFKASDNGWITKEDAEEYDFHAKTSNSVGKTYALPNEDASETAKKLSDLLDIHGQFPVVHATVNRRLRKVADKAGLDRRVTAHALRHTYGCRLAQQEKAPNTIMAQMRHKDYEMTMWYSELRGMRQKRALQREWSESIDF